MTALAAEEEGKEKFLRFLSPRGEKGELHSKKTKLFGRRPYFFNRGFFPKDNLWGKLGKFRFLSYFAWLGGPWNGEKRK